MKQIEDTLNNLDLTGNMRVLPADCSDSSHIDFSSNDYLGIASDKSLRQQFIEGLQPGDLQFSSSASRLLSSRQRHYNALESLLQQLYSRPALLFNSGYHANTGMVSALGGKNTLFIADKLVHASIIDGLILSQSKFLRFRHNDYNHLFKLLREHGINYDRVVILAESIYSMDGDIADMDLLIEAKKLHPNTILYLDEAHAIGVCGEAGLGLGRDHIDDIDIVVGTFGKALASEGAYAIMSPLMRKYMINKCRSLIFSTAISPLTAQWSAYTLGHSVGMDTARRHLRSLSDMLHTELGTSVASHIQPLIIGDASKTVALSKKLLDEGLKVLPIRTPTVPPGTERLRISLSAALGKNDIAKLVSTLNAINR